MVQDVIDLVKLEVIKKKTSSKVASFLTKKSLALKLYLTTKEEQWDIVRSFQDIQQLHKVLHKEFPEIEVPPLPAIPSHAKSCDLDAWGQFFDVILGDPSYSESGFLLTFIRTRTRSDEEGMQSAFGEIIKEGPLIYKKKSKKYHKKYTSLDVWCIIRLRLLFIYRSRFDSTPMAMIPLDDCTVQVNAATMSPREESPVKQYEAVGMSIEGPGLSPRQAAEQKKNDVITLVPRGSHKFKFIPVSADERDQWLEAIDKVAKARATTHFRVVSTLQVQIEKAAHLKAKDTNGFSDPYTIAHIENQQQRTATIRKTLDPVWHETVYFHVSWYSAVLYLSVWDEDVGKSPDFLGKIAIPVAALPVDEEIDIWQALVPRDSQKVSGMVNLRIKYSFTIDDEEKSEAGLQVFALPLSVSKPIPSIIKRAMDYVEDTALSVEGLFRLSANSIELNEMRRSIDRGADVDFAREPNIHNVTGLIKLWLRELPEPAFTFDAYPLFLSAIRQSRPEDLVANLKQCVESLPEAHKKLVAELLPFLKRISEAQQTTKMTTNNLSVVFSPSLLRSKVETLDSLMIDSADVAKVMAQLIDHAREIVSLDQESIPA